MSDQQSISDTSSDSPNAFGADKWDSIRRQIQEDENLYDEQKAVLDKFLAGSLALSHAQAARDFFGKLAEMDKDVNKDRMDLESALDEAVFHLGVELRDKAKKWIAGRGSQHMKVYSSIIVDCFLFD